MIKEHDERAKLIAEQALDFLGEVQREVEIPTSDAQRIDLWLRRQHFPDAVPPYLRLLSDLFPEDSMVEAFSEAVRLLSFYESHRKQYQWRHHLDQKRREKAPEGAELPLLRPPLLWLLSAGRPDALFEEHKIYPKAGFPPGVYAFDGAWRIGLLVISELPPGPHTLLLRLMGSPAVRRRALEELHRMPPDDPDALSLRGIVATLQHTFARATNISQQERDEFMTVARAEFERYTQQIRQDGRQDGRKEAQQRAIFTVLKARGLQLSDVGQARILACEDEDQLERWLLAAVSAPSEAALFS